MWRLFIVQQIIELFHSRDEGVVLAPRRIPKHALKWLYASIFAAAEQETELWLPLPLTTAHSAGYGILDKFQQGRSHQRCSLGIEFW